MTAAPPSKWACPQCGQIDQVQKVSAIVKAGATTGKTKGDGDDPSPTLAHEYQTQLNKLFAAPKKPTIITWSAWQPSALRGLVAVVITFELGMAVAQFVLDHSNPHRDPQFDTVVRGLIVFASFFLLIFTVILIITLRRRAYQRQRDKWKQSYYCHRCDGFYIPKGSALKDTNLIAPEKMQKWLRE